MMLTHDKRQLFSELNIPTGFTQALNSSRKKDFSTDLYMEFIKSPLIDKYDIDDTKRLIETKDEIIESGSFTYYSEKVIIGTFLLFKEKIYFSIAPMVLRDNPKAVKMVSIDIKQINKRCEDPRIICRFT